MTRLTTIALTLCLMAGFSPIAGATDFAEDGTVDVFISLSVNEDTNLDFGAVTDRDGDRLVRFSGDVVVARRDRSPDVNPVRVGGDRVGRIERDRTVAIRHYAKEEVLRLRRSECGENVDVTIMRKIGGLRGRADSHTQAECQQPDAEGGQCCSPISGFITSMCGRDAWCPYASI